MRLLETIAAIILFAAVMAFLVVVPWMLPIVLRRWVLGPIDRAAERRETPPQFTLADVLALFLLTQPILGTVCWVVPEHGGRRAAVCVLVLVVAAAFWGVSVQWLNAAGVRKNAHRVLFTAIVYPFTILGCTAAVILTLLATSASFGVVTGKERVGVLLWTLVALPLVVAMLAAFAKFTRYVVAESCREQAAEQDTAPAADQDRDDTT
jgi:hypothetical protein